MLTSVIITNICADCTVVTWFVRSVIGLLLGRLWFEPMSFHVRYMMSKMAGNMVYLMPTSRLSL